MDEWQSAAAQPSRGTHPGKDIASNAGPSSGTDSAPQQQSGLDCWKRRFIIACSCFFQDTAHRKTDLLLIYSTSHGSPGFNLGMQQLKVYPFPSNEG